MLQEAPQVQDSLFPTLPRKSPQCPGTLCKARWRHSKHESHRESKAAQPEVLTSQSKQSQRSQGPQSPTAGGCQSLSPVAQPPLQVLRRALSGLSGTAVCAWPPLWRSSSGSRTLCCQLEADLVLVPACYLWQRPFHSWGSHTCMDGHLCELVRGPARKSKPVALWHGTGKSSASLPSHTLCPSFLCDTSVHVPLPSSR